MHVRSQIRVSIVSALEAIDDFLGSVHQSRDTIFEEDCYNVIAGDEEIEPSTIHDGSQERTLSVIIEVNAKGNDAVDDKLDSMIADAEMAIDGYADGLFAHLQAELLAIDSDYDEAVSEDVAQAVMRYSVKYEVMAGNPTDLI